MSDLALLGAYLVAYAGLHSLLAADRVKDAVASCCPRFFRRYRLTYTVISLVTLYPLIPLSAGSPTLYVVEGHERWVMRLVQAIGLAGFAWSVRAIDLGRFLGWRSATVDDETLATGGPYRVCRHPLYFFASLFLAAKPTVTAAYALFTVWTVAYFWIGSWVEERRLLASYGSAYREYRDAVPHFLPLPRKRKAGPHS